MSASTLPLLPSRNTPARAARDAGARMRALYAREKPLFVLGLIGILVGLACLVRIAISGRYVPPEGDLMKPATFDIAVGIYLLTLALYAPFARFTHRGHSIWVAFLIGIAIYTFSIETIQQLRGLDPRFSKYATPIEQIAGGVFFLLALGLIVLYAILAVKLARRGAGEAGRLLLASIGYASTSAAIGFGVGIWMSLQGGSQFRDTDILPIHALGFHGLQAVPLVALLHVWAGTAYGRARRFVHFAGLAWLAACGCVLIQTIRGFPLDAKSALTLVAVAFLLAWLAAFVASLREWARSGWHVPMLPLRS